MSRKLSGYPRNWILHLAISACVLGLLGMASGRSALLYMCSDALPAFQGRIQTAGLALAPWIELDSNRNVASERSKQKKSEQRKMLEMVQQDRISWQRWSEEQLREAQKQLDVLEHHPSLSQAGSYLSKAAKDLVGFHGYAQQGNVMRMAVKLEEIESKLARVREIACDQGVDGRAPKAAERPDP